MPTSLVCPQCEHPCEPSHRFCPVCGFPVGEVSQKTDDSLVGTTLPGGYVILELISVGGMGRVYRAEQKTLGRTVAVKIIHPHLSGDENASVRFITEARATSRLNHPNSVAVIDFGKNNGQLYLVMEFLRGRDLARLMLEDGLPSFRRVVDILCQVLAALGEAHELGIIHRDLKPENVVVERLRSGGDLVKVVDFGLAKITQPDVQSTSITSPGIVCGTPDFMAPEQARGEPIDPRSDLYACGVILFQMLTGRLPFEAESPTQVVLMHLSVPAPDPRDIAPRRDIPEPLAEVCLRALEKEVDRRFQTAEELVEALRAALVELDAPVSLRHAQSSRAVTEIVPCPTCGALSPVGQKFCGECGGRLQRGPSSRPSTAPASSAMRLPLPLVGRESDLAWLLQQRFDVGGSVQCVRLVGEPGVGKTRLLGELVAEAVADGDIVLEARPDPFWAEVAYFTLRRAITGLAHLPPDGGRPTDWVGASPEARSGLAELFGTSAHTGEHASLRARGEAQQGVAPELRRFALAEALRWAMTRASEAAAGRRVLLTLDDLYAMDGASRNAFADVLAEPPLVPLLVVATHPPGFGAGWQGVERALGPLPGDVAQALLRSPSLRAGGEGMLPLYVDQAVRFSLEGGGEPPRRLADLIARRVERLGVDALRVLQAIAVVGDAADRPTIHRLLPDLEGIEDALKALTTSGMIEPSPLSELDRALLGLLGRTPGEAVFRSTHPLLREVVLVGTPVAVRRELHARATVTSSGEPLVLPIEVQALHAYHSNDSVGALMLLELLADRASARGDDADAVIALRRGLDLARREIFRGELEDPVRAVVIFSRKLGNVLMRMGALTDAEGVLREALDLAGPSGADRAIVLSSLAHLARERSRAAEAADFMREALELAVQARESDLARSLQQMQEDWELG